MHAKFLLPIPLAGALAIPSPAPNAPGDFAVSHVLEARRDPGPRPAPKPRPRPASPPPRLITLDNEGGARCRPRSVPKLDEKTAKIVARYYSLGEE
ncbi:hypothetical protein GGTG_13284 [Gaeumannomyces tritici R3-111a-1]|uniref:Uncharacterized protein n=1 Tax=Gaeumannomyces tritici (strain R3-111a-1) TaxID=644352 RepID=J3PIF6_GAET3|nr:hypothetical protein GGTG_13284 [Gaeumannomyces tritici R3-111a-1]EJT69175.1 hypothetical protein GGTG_13284 [Gaeumannomyces tritici R3-111a-1]